MGNMFTPTTNKEILSEAIDSMLGRISHQKFISNKKTEALFMKQIDDLCKKILYVAYPWAQELYDLLTATFPSQLYCFYLRVLQQNCKLDKSQEIIFYAIKLRKIFLLQIQNKYNMNQSTASVAKLKELIFEAKSYFMVLSWMKKIASLNEEKSEETATFAFYRHEQKVYNFLIEIASKTFVIFPERQTQSKLQCAFQCSIEFQNSKAVSILNQISNCKYFHERQRAIASLQQALLGDEQNLQKHLRRIQRMFGKDKVFGYLFVIREIGSIDVSYLWEKFYGTASEKIFR